MTDFAKRRHMMVDTQVRPSDVTKYPILEAMLRIPREAFVPHDRTEAAYVGENLAIGPRRVMLEPRTLAKMMDAVNIQNSDLVLDIGCGYGYSSAVIAEIAEAVIAVEEDPALATEAEDRLAEHGIDNVAVVTGPLSEGAAQHGPYGAIFVQGAVEEVHADILAQLKEGGRIVAIFAEGELGVVRIGFQIDGRVSWRFSFNAGAPIVPGFEKLVEFAL
ncbi:protein-L-isoaspartate O-methyltransferase [Pseudoruegeria sp. SK021]|uniref:protein-L-isoaspartate O-methyltransferase family protein n=1 Tax=Pseudoruegeria sp. SK021 TaxID=1933035 RepID=UPI000A261DD6|nr:protein-L-isoaspartate O-methyltransferase [Pseudoruegeria sp. SK021]OSP56626.1 protein-L-isoaspartate O-methyltransferase [Pseudoruegeria sp. SK021]